MAEEDCGADGRSEFELLLQDALVRAVLRKKVPNALAMIPSWFDLRTIGDEVCQYVNQLPVAQAIDHSVKKFGPAFTELLKYHRKTVNWHPDVLVTLSAKLDDLSWLSDFIPSDWTAFANWLNDFSRIEKSEVLWAFVANRSADFFMKYPVISLVTSDIQDLMVIRVVKDLKPPQSHKSFAEALALAQLFDAPHVFALLASKLLTSPDFLPLVVNGINSRVETGVEIDAVDHFFREGPTCPNGFVVFKQICFATGYSPAALVCLFIATGEISYLQNLMGEVWNQAAAWLAAQPASCLLAFLQQFCNARRVADLPNDYLNRLSGEKLAAAVQLLSEDERYGLVSQMRRCSVSIPSNIAEGYGRETER